jgi:alkanesulfonate monooxygenase SsuD/methylene tetrahydromethanopterin reductase-like flavin-dependent oxidoreductase (luciferase family)
MHIGMGAFLSGFGRDMPDQEIYRNELELASLAEPMGFDSIWAPEHHFTDYCMTPDPLQFLAFMAGRTKRVELGTMIIVLPWRSPARVAGEIAMLDNLSDGRFLLGIGRGLARHEFEGLGVPMEATRPIFNEMASFLVESLEAGSMEHDGEYVKVPKRAIRPAPTRSFAGRTYGAAVSPESLEVMAGLGAGILIIPQKPWDTTRAELDLYRAAYEKRHGTPAPKPIAAVHVYCDKDGAKAEELGHHFNQLYYHRVMSQYELAGHHFDSTAGYEYYRQVSERIAASGEDRAAAFYADLHVHGDPKQCLEKLEWIAKTIDCERLFAFFSYSGIPYEDVRSSLNTFQEHVRPVVQRDF